MGTGDGVDDARELKLDAQGLLTVVVQDRASGEVRMLAHATPEALARTEQTGLAHFWSRSRRALWQKGEESGNVLHVREVWIDCDGDAVLYLVDPEGPSCHTGARTCFFHRRAPSGEAADAEASLALPVLAALEATVEARRRASASESYTRALLDGGPRKIAGKVREEADELAVALEEESDARVISEAADVLYHAMVGLSARGLSLSDVARELGRRFGVSGHEEKARR
jgi:phosphoribosyl-AMP cyclohydrolase / phosphoribosyl-ATP pyrophosphohydrolase